MIRSSVDENGISSVGSGSEAKVEILSPQPQDFYQCPPTKPRLLHYSPPIK